MKWVHLTKSVETNSICFNGFCMTIECFTNFKYCDKIRISLYAKDFPSHSMKIIIITNRKKIKTIRRKLLVIIIIIIIIIIIKVIIIIPLL